MDDGFDDRSLGKLFKVFIEVDFELLFFFISIKKVGCGWWLVNTSH